MKKLICASLVCVSSYAYSANSPIVPPSSVCGPMFEGFVVNELYAPSGETIDGCRKMALGNERIDDVSKCLVKQFSGLPRLKANLEMVHGTLRKSWESYGNVVSTDVRKAWEIGDTEHGSKAVVMYDKKSQGVLFVSLTPVGVLFRGLDKSLVKNAYELFKACNEDSLFGLIDYKYEL